MELSALLVAMGCMGGLGALFSVGLSIANKKLYVEEDPRVILVADSLPGANCGSCGFAGCAHFAENLVNGHASLSDCNVASDEAIEEVAGTLGIEAVPAEREVARFTDVCPVVIIRPAAVYGPRDGESLRLIRLARRGFRIRPCREDSFFSTVHVADLTDALILAARKLPGEKSVYFIGDGAVYSLLKTFDTLFEIMGRKPSAIDLPWGLARAGMTLSASLFPRSSAAFYLDKIKEMGNKYWVCDNSRARKELGFAPRFDLATGLKNTISWYRKQGWLS